MCGWLLLTALLTGFSMMCFTLADIALIVHGGDGDAIIAVGEG